MHLKPTKRITGAAIYDPFIGSYAGSIPGFFKGMWYITLALSCFMTPWTTKGKHLKTERQYDRPSLSAIIAWFESD
jgi:hypothetical protein